jgi:hypothetical protein
MMKNFAVIADKTAEFAHSQRYELSAPLYAKNHA